MSRNEEVLLNDLARFYHQRLHKSQKTWFCESDRLFAEETVALLETSGWRIEAHEDNRST